MDVLMSYEEFLGSARYSLLTGRDGHMYDVLVYKITDRVVRIVSVDESHCAVVVRLGGTSWCWGRTANVYDASLLGEFL